KRQGPGSRSREHVIECVYWIEQCGLRFGLKRDARHEERVPERYGSMSDLVRRKCVEWIEVVDQIADVGDSLPRIPGFELRPCRKLCQQVPGQRNLAEEHGSVVHQNHRSEQQGRKCKESSLGFGLEYWTELHATASPARTR